MRIRWNGPRHYRKGRLEIGRVWVTWRGWHMPVSYMIGSTRTFSVGPLAVFVHPRFRTMRMPPAVPPPPRLRDLEFDRLDILKLRLMRATVCRVRGHKFRTKFSGSICIRCRNFQPR